MSKTVRQVFLIIGTLVLCFIVWQLVFNEGGILKTMYNAMITGINDQWAKISGSDDNLLPEWGDNADTNGKGFEIDTEAGGGA